MKAAMNFSAGWIMTSLLVGTVGGGFFLYGKKQSRMPQLFAGIVLVVGSGFVSSPVWMCVGAGCVLAAVWFAVRAGL